MFPSCFLSGLLGRRPRSWAPVVLPSCFLFLASWVGWVGRGQKAGLALGSLHIAFSGLRWVGRGKEAGLALGSLHISFLGSWVGWVGRCQKAGLCMGWVGRARLGLPHIVLSRMGQPRPRNWASVGLPSCFLISGSWVGWVGRRHRALPRSWAPVGLPSCFLLSGLLGRMGGPPPNKLGSALGSHIAFLGFWVGWVGRGQEAGLPLVSLHVSLWVLGWMGGVRSHCISGLLGRMGGPRQEAGLLLFVFPSFRAPGSDGWAAANKLGSRWAPFILFGLLGGWVGRGQELVKSRMGGPRPRSWAPFILPFWAPGSDGWAAAKKLGFRWVPFIFPFWAPGSDGWAAATLVGLPSCFLLSGLPGRMGGPHWAPFILFGLLG